MVSRGDSVRARDSSRVTDPGFFANSGLWFPRLSPKEVLGGIAHVDSIFFMSYLFGKCCQVTHGCALFAEDTGMEPEPDEDPMPFLSSLVSTKSKRLFYRPNNGNRSYALGRVETQKQLRLGPHLDYYASLPILKPFLSGKIAAFEALCQGRTVIAWGAMSELLFEMFRLGYPPSHVLSSLSAFNGIRACVTVDGSRRLLRLFKRVWPQYFHRAVPPAILSLVVSTSTGPRRALPFPRPGATHSFLTSRC